MYSPIPFRKGMGSKLMKCPFKSLKIFLPHSPIGGDGLHNTSGGKLGSNSPPGYGPGLMCTLSSWVTSKR